MEGLLHLCGIAAAVSIAYVGLDQLNWDDRRFETHLSDARRKIGESLLRYGLQVGTLNPSDSCDLFPTPIRLRLFVLCHVGRVRVKMGPFNRVRHWFILLRHAPLLPYFDGRYDRMVIKWMALVLILSLLYLSAEDVFHFDTFPLPFCPHPVWSINACVWSVPVDKTIPYFYAAAAITLVWVCITGYFSQRIQEIKERCEKLDETVNASADRMRTQIQKFLPNHVPQPPVPPPQVHPNPEQPQG